MTVRVDIPPAMFEWAARRARRDLDGLADSFARLPEWLAGEAQPTLKQLEKFAKATHTPVGYFFLPEPPSEEVPIADLRTVADHSVARPSADLLDTIYLCERRQAWYREHLRYEDPQRTLNWVRSVTTADDPMTVAAGIRRALDFQMSERRSFRTWTEALRTLIERTEDLGVLVMINGVVGNNTHRALDVDEFRGFALADEVAPLVFVNGKDSKSAQMFTLVHEVAHLWLGSSALSDLPLTDSPHEVERWCNQVAAEVLVPGESLTAEAEIGGDLAGELARLARLYKVSTLVLLRRMHELGLLDADDFRAAYAREHAKVMALVGGGRGGNFYATQSMRTSPTFARALVASALQGDTLLRDAMQLLAISKVSTLQEMGNRYGLSA
ncbi:MAG: DNA-binding protein [Sandaracinus sp.]|nr:DNA-binding protein [Sandaracinus sp.]